METTAITKLESALIQGDLSKLNDTERLQYYSRICESIGLNPLTKPFEFIKLSGRLTLYAKKDCTDQLRKIHGISIIEIQGAESKGIYLVRATAQTSEGRTDTDIGCVNIAGLSGEALANAIMKCYTKAKRRVTLAICGLGMLDETEIERPDF